jgi:hypothetical protein
MRCRLGSRELSAEGVCPQRGGQGQGAVMTLPGVPVIGSRAGAAP